MYNSLNGIKPTEVIQLSAGSKSRANPWEALEPIKHTLGNAALPAGVTITEDTIRDANKKVHELLVKRNAVIAEFTGFCEELSQIASILFEGCTAEEGKHKFEMLLDIMSYDYVEWENEIATIIQIIIDNNKAPDPNIKSMITLINTNIGDVLSELPMGGHYIYPSIKHTFFIQKTGDDQFYMFDNGQGISDNCTTKDIESFLKEKYKKEIDQSSLVVASRSIQKNEDEKANINKLFYIARSGNMGLLQKEIDKCKNENVSLDKFDEDGWTALMLAAVKDHVDVVKELVAASADVDKADNNGWTALMSAASKGHVDVVKALIAAGADKYSVDSYGRTALSIAKAKNNIDIVIELSKVDENPEL